MPLLCTYKLNWARRRPSRDRETSIKNAERCNRRSTTSTQWKNIALGHNILQWKKFMRNPENKTSLVKFLIQQWKEPANREKLHEHSLYVTCEEACYIITKDHWDEIQGLKSAQEDADTRLFLHAAEDGYRSIVITAEDTDVLILCVSLS